MPNTVSNGSAFNGDRPLSAGAIALAPVVSGVSNQEFCSVLRRVPYPFAGTGSETHLEMFHVAHGNYETRAPVRTMQFATLGGEDTLIAAYACSLMEPGRIKRGIGPGSTHAPALSPHNSYRMEVSTGGQVLTQAFGVLPPVLEPLLEKCWRVTRPTVGSRDGLEVTFDRVMDDAIVADEIEVLRADGTRFDGVQSLTADGRKLVFQPADHWEDSEYRLVFSRRLEDVSGNRLGEALDHMVSQGQRSRAGVVSFHPAS